MIGGRKLAGSSDRVRFTVQAYFDVAFPRGDWIEGSLGKSLGLRNDKLLLVTGTLLGDGFVQG